jgi:hypothetical protein
MAIQSCGPVYAIIYPSGFCIATDTPTPILSERPNNRKHEKNIRNQSDDGNLLEVMNRVAESITAGSSADNGYSEKRSRLGAHRKAETESLMKLLSQKRELSE